MQLTSCSFAAPCAVRMHSTLLEIPNQGALESCLVKDKVAFLKYLIFAQIIPVFIVLHIFWGDNTVVANGNFTSAVL